MPLDRDFERFLGGAGEPASKRVHVTISPQNLILLNRNAFEMFGRPEAVRLSYSRQRDTIAIEPTSPRLNDAFPVIANNHNWRINAAPFCRHFGIKIDAQTKFLAPVIKRDAMLLKLSETISVARQKRRKR